MDNIKEIISEAVEKLLKDEELRNLFMEEPTKALEKLFNVDLPDELIDPVIDGIKAKLTVETVQDTLEDAANLFKKLF